LYALARHPQYTGLFIALFGEGIVHWPTLFSVALFPVIVFIYYRLSLREERTVIAEFGDEYMAYKKRVPMFIPRREQWKSFVKQAKI
jgi:protein-S-isoprenylcysteine O-methyltransferase Ste14